MERMGRAFGCLKTSLLSRFPNWTLVFRVVQALTSYIPQTSRGFLRFFLALYWAELLMMCYGPLLVSAAQEPGGIPRLTVPDKTPDVLTPGIRPDAIIMRNGMGESILVPKSRFEDFERFLGSEKDIPSAISLDKLERMEVSVTVDQTIARLKVNAHANLSESNKNWLSIPIGLGAAQIIPSQRTGEVGVEFPSVRILDDSSGYVWRLAPGNQGQRSLQFEASCNLRNSPQEQSLRLDLPLVPTIVRFELPIGQWELVVVGKGSEVVEPFRDTDSHSVAIAHISGGSTTFSWTKKSVADQVQAIEVESQTKYVPLTQAGEFRAMANLAIRGPKTLGGRRFLITLPDRSQWREPMTSSVSFPGYRFGRSEVTAANSNTVLLLEFEEAFSRTEIELPIEWQTSNLPDSNPISFSMLRVEGIQRHVGSVDLAVPRNVSFQWEPQAGIQFVRQSQSSDASDTLNYNFRFNQQTEPLIVHWNIGNRASDLKASYHIVYDSSVLRLSGTIDILGDVRLLPFLQLDVRGWTVDRVQLQPSGRDLDLIAVRSRSALDADGTQQNTTSIPLSLGELLDALQPKNGNSVGNRTLGDGTPMPTDSISPTPLLSSREESIRQPTRSISFALSHSNGLVENSENTKREFGFSLPMLSWLDPESQQRLSVCVGGEMTIQSTTSKLGDGERPSETFKRVPEALWNQSEQKAGQGSTLSTSLSLSRLSILKYRVATSTSWVDWNGISEKIGTVIRASARTRIALTEEGLDISQTWRLVCEGRTAKTLRIAVPKEWLTPLSAPEVPGNSIEWSIDNVPVSANLIQGSLAGQVPPFVSPLFEQQYGWVQLIIPDTQTAPESTHERKLTIRKRLNYREKLLNSPSTFDWPLPWIAADRPDDSFSMEAFVGDIVHDDGIRCVVQSPLGGIEEVVPLSESRSSLIPFDRTQLEPRLVGGLSLQSNAKELGCDVESVWLQTIVNAVEQRDRFVVRLSTRDNSISLSLPASRIANSEFIVNGRKALPNRNPSDVNRVDIQLDTTGLNSIAAAEKTYVLEVFLWRSNKSQWLKSLHAELPSIVNCRTRAPLVWQIVVPTTVHMIGNTSTLLPGYRWAWRDLWFGRKSDWTQETIGNQIGATSQPFVSQQTNEFVFFSLDHTVEMKVWTAPRHLLWAPVALFVLIGSYLVMEFRWIRKPWIGILLLLSSLAFSQWAWELSIALVQCFVAAIGIAFMYSILKWMVDRRARRRSVFALRPSSPLIPSAVRSPVLSGSGVLSKTATAASPANIASLVLPPSTTISAEAEGVQ